MPPVSFDGSQSYGGAAVLTTPWTISSCAWGTLYWEWTALSWVAEFGLRWSKRRTRRLCFCSESPGSDRLDP